ncbi:UBP-type zinc finger domain-containing protein [Mycobacterium frederiksbergense]|uniref:UBP-type domain-containing protein n=1 Tax=Mycolicibacterium frederiksbergense TaxID=117567 RepID=A0A6H0S1U3_9MYCO|nr:UBP-type zinc finger domain-containing protein [Mycolicibacterium frederiksbergense]MCV7044675.1 UBP-type zinc finger domain-containing protein [Mycolicibacterium frederiksbergense]QIV81453.1 hypothetical protein EXE63_11515 [Mycolicibacterium frederiksbergense]
MRKSSRRRSAAAAAAPVSCEHLHSAVGIVDPEPLTPGRCQECAHAGAGTWAHLRMCLSCGHVGCCDSSPHQHATEHFRQTGHAVMRSAEPGESWRWCYVDSRMG